MIITKERLSQLNVFCTQDGIFLECNLALIPRYRGSLYIDRNTSSTFKLNRFSREYEPILYIDCKKEVGDNVLYLFDYRKFKSLDINTYEISESVNEKQVSLINRCWDSIYYKTVLFYGRQLTKMLMSNSGIFDMESNFVWVRLTPIYEHSSMQLFGDKNSLLMDSISSFSIDEDEFGAPVIYQNIFENDIKNAC